MENLKKTELIDKVAKATDLSKVKTEEVISALQDVIIEEVTSGKRVQLTGFVSFEKRTREPRKGFNPATREEMEIPAKNYVAMKPLSRFKDALNNIPAL